VWLTIDYQCLRGKRSLNTTYFNRLTANLFEIKYIIYKFSASAVNLMLFAADARNSLLFKDCQSLNHQVSNEKRFAV